MNAGDGEPHCSDICCHSPDPQTWAHCTRRALFAIVNDEGVTVAFSCRKADHRGRIVHVTGIGHHWTPEERDRRIAEGAARREKINRRARWRRQLKEMRNMGTNFYWLRAAPRCEKCDHPQGDPTEGEHIGKRSAAGFFCWDCNRTLCPIGNEGIHSGDSRPWPKTCPTCGKGPVEGAETLTKGGSAAIELGFAKAREERPTGVSTTSSFSWAQEPAIVREQCEQLGDDEPVVIDEYKRTYTGLGFLRMLRSNCGVEFTHHIGRDFS